MKHKILCILFLALLLSSLIACNNARLDPEAFEDKNIVKIGYFHGGRTHLLYRAYVNSEFENEDVDVAFFTKYAHKDNFYEVPKKHEEMNKIFEEEEEIFKDKLISIKNKKDIEYPEFHKFGFVTGPEIADSILQIELDGGTMGESSFVYHISKNSSIVAVAMLGYEEKNSPAKAIVVGKDIAINKPEDFKGKTLTYRKAGPLDKMLLLEFLESIGLEEKDVVIKGEVWNDEQKILIGEGKADAGLFHFYPTKTLVEENMGYIYSKLDWINPETSHALLVFNKDFYDTHRQEIKKIIRAYIKRIHYERNLTEAERKKPQDKGLQIELDFKGLSLAEYKDKPFVSIDLLEDIQDLELKHGIIENKANISNFIDNGIVSEVLEELGLD